MAQAELIVGSVIAQDGTQITQRGFRDGGQRVADAHAHFNEAAYRGNVYTAMTASGGVTPVSQAPAAGVGTTSCFALWNPKNSGKILSVLRSTMGYVSGTLGAGAILYVAHTNPAQAAITGTAITPVNCQLGNGSTGAGLAFTTATVPASGALLRTLCNLQASLASTAVAPWQVTDLVDGEFLIYPGAALGFQGFVAAGASPLVLFSMSWEELQYPT